MVTRFMMKKVYRPRKPEHWCEKKEAFASFFHRALINKYARVAE